MGRGQIARPRCIGRAFVVAIALLFWAGAWAQPRLRVVTTTSDLRSLVEAVGGEHVDAVHLAAPEADIENYQPRPRDLLRLRDAALVVRVGADFDLWFGLLAPGGLPAPMVERLHRELAVVPQRPDVQESIKKQGMLAEYRTSAEFADYVKADSVKYQRIIKDADISVK